MPVRHACARTIGAMRRTPPALVGLLLALSFLASCAQDEEPANAAGPACDFVEEGEAAKPADLPPDHATETGDVAVTIETSQGDIGATLDAAGAPCTVTSFLSLAEQGYFDDTSCHRLTLAGTGIFVLQCGDPLANGMGGPGYTIPDELTGGETYPAGTVAMARTRAPHSGGSQFFLVYQDTPLPPDYTVFGTMSDDGLAVVEKVAAGGTATPPQGPPTLTTTITGVSVG